MATQTSIINRALRFLGQDEIATSSQSQKVAIGAKSSWDDILDWCLRCHTWNFSQKWESFALLAEKPPFSFNFAYQVPSDCIRLIDIRQQGDLSEKGSGYYLVGTKLYTSINPCLARYVYRSVDPTFWPSDFVEVVSLKLAIDLAAMIVPGDSSMRKDLDNRLLIALDIARKNDNTENIPVALNKENMCSFLMARRGGER